MKGIVRYISHTAAIALMSILALLDIRAAEQVSIPYICGFEDSQVQELSEWKLNPQPPGAAPLLDRWMVGNLDFYEGHKSLYISCDTGKNIRFGTSPNVVVAYRTFRFPKGSYDVSFDWKCAGVEGRTGLYVCVLTDANDSLSVAGSATLPNWVNATARVFNGKKMLCGSPSWQTSSFQLNVGAGRRLKLAFVWQNSNTDPDIPIRDAACIDNIQITSTNCPKPTALTTRSVCDTIWAQWNGASEKYQCQYRMRGSSVWQNATISKTQTSLTASAVITNIQEGAYDIRVRGICAIDTSAWVSANSVLVFCPGNHCINYVTLDSAVCEVGSAGKADSFSPVSPVNHGSEDKYSRHTVCWTQNQFDPRTNNMLSTVPPGEFASVRLGNWNNGAEAERISYSYTVDSATASILLLKYAVVLEDPAHELDAQPGFKLEILDEDGDLIDPTCGAAEFSAGYDTKGWNVLGRVVWKNWTTVGLNLGAYDGQTLTIRLTTQDCTYSAHYGYAYFTLGCTSGHITGNSCGDMPEITLSAPEGFNYSWSNPDIPAFHSDKQMITVPSNDTTTYFCDVSFLEKSECSFRLSTQLFPRFPKADFSWRIEHKDCSTQLYLQNRSAVVSRIDGRDTVLDSEKCQTYYWDIDNSALLTSQSDPVYTVPNEGGRIKVSLIAGISDDQCQADTTYYIHVPAIGCHADTLYEEMCFGEQRIFGNNFIMKSGVYYDSLTNIYGCDSITVLYMTVLPQTKDSVLYDTICFGDTYTWNGKTYSATGKYEKWLENEHGCDSVAVLQLYVRPEVKFTYTKVDVADAPHSGSISIVPDSTLGNDFTYSLNGVMGAPLSGLDGGVYKLVVYNKWNCPSDTVSIMLYAECLDLAFDSVDYVCAGDKAVILPFTLNAGILSTYSLKFDDKALAEAHFVNIDSASLTADNHLEIVLPDSCHPGQYTASVTFHDIICNDFTKDFTLSVYYDSAIIAQKWNDVLAVYNKQYNGGYCFSSFRWYRNGRPIPNATGAYLYLADGELSEQDRYHVLLRRADDGVAVPSCPFTPRLRTDFTDYITVVSLSAVSPKVLVYTPNSVVTVEVFNAQGQLLSSQRHSGQNQEEVALPLQQGVYLIHVYNDKISCVEKVFLR